MLVVAQWLDHGRDDDTVKDCLRKRGLNVRQARRIMHDRSEWWRFVRGEYMVHSRVDEPLTLTR